ncbi:MAG: hypothetical protein U9Q70_09585 [Chloroflexota bacterium]|nr:hypothetical protein [Chloroflexota bacterium]
MPRPTTIPTVDTVDDLWEWTIVAGPSEEIQAGFDYDGEILIWRKWTTPAGRSQTQVVQSGGTVTDLHQGPPGWEVTGQVLDGGRVVIVEYEESQGDYNLWVYELESGARTLLEQWGGEPKRHQIPMISLDGDRLAWLTTLDDGQSCIFIRNLATGTQFEAVCRPVDSNSVVIAPYLRWPVLTYQLIELAVDSDSDCRNIYTLRLPDGRPQPHVVTECEGFSGAADETVLVWTEMRSETAFPWKVPLYGVGRDGQVVKLGVAGAGSVAICEGRAYWKKECSNCPDEIRSWVPGEPVKVLYRSPDVQGESYATGISYATTLPRCHGSWVSLERTGGRHDTPGSPDTILIAQRPKDD